MSYHSESETEHILPGAEQTTVDLDPGDHGDQGQPNQSASSCSRTFKPMQILTLITLLCGNVSSAMFSSLLAPFFPTEASKKGATLYEVGLIFGTFQLIQFLMSPVFGRYMTKLGAKYLFVAGNFIVSACAILFGMLEWCPNGQVYVAMCFVVRAVEAVGSAAATTATFTIGTYAFPRQISTIMGLLQASSCIGLVTGPPVGGLLFSNGGFYLPFLVTGSVFMFFGLISVFVLRPATQANPSTRDGCHEIIRLLRRPLVIVVGYMVLIGQATLGFTDVTLAEYLDEIKS